MNEQKALALTDPKEILKAAKEAETRNCEESVSSMRITTKQKGKPMKNKRNNFTETFRSLIALLAIGLGMTLLFVAAGLVDGSGSTGEVTAVSLLALLCVGGGILGLRMEAYDAVK